ncbi:hypothetical protein ACJ41O_009863 [Fusarium nematophilum]
MAEAGLIDPTKTGNYPVILGDALLGKTSNEIFTGIQYNHKPTLSSIAAPDSARLKPSVSGKTTSYDLTYTDNDDKYAFTGTRTTGGNQYVLYFDPNREAFVLDLVDSTFNMNVTRLPDNADPDSLRRQFPHIDGKPRPVPKASTKAEKGSANLEKPAPKSRAKATTQKKEVKRKPEKKQAPKNIELSLPVPMPEQPKKPAEPKRRPAPEEEEEEEDDDDDDGGLLIEYPDADSGNTRKTDFSPAFPSVRRFDDFMNQRESEGDDADGEEDDEPDIDFKLPSPVNNHTQQQEAEPMDVDFEEQSAQVSGDDLEKDLENAFGVFENDNSQQDSGDESEISEED